MEEDCVRRCRWSRETMDAFLKGLAAPEGVDPLGVRGGLDGL